MDEGWPVLDGCLYSFDDGLSLSFFDSMGQRDLCGCIRVYSGTVLVC